VVALEDGAIGVSGDGPGGHLRDARPHEVGDRRVAGVVPCPAVWDAECFAVETCRAFAEEEYRRIVAGLPAVK